MSHESDSEPYPPDTLGMTSDEMRRLGHKVVDMVVARLCSRHVEKVIRTGSPAELLGVLGGPLPGGPSDVDQSLELLASTALSYQQHGDHPRYFARVPGPSSFAAVLGDWLGIGFNSIATSWTGGSGPASVELVVLQWLRDLLGLPTDGEGILLSGGSMANFTAFAAARAMGGVGMVYLSDQAHASLPRALRLLGFEPQQIRILPSDLNYRMPLDLLASTIQLDKKAGRSPRIVVGSAGTTNTGSIDPLAKISDLCATAGLWFHVDGAYGAAAAACPEARPLLAGIERADSMVIDPHKWLFQPYGIGCTFLRQAGALEAAFSMTPEYLKDTASAPGETSFGNRGPELTRRSRALKLWMTFRTYGAERIRTAIKRGIELAEYAETALRRQPRCWEIVTPAQIGIVTFALKGASAADHESRVKSLTQSGFAAMTTTKLKERSVLRLCTINPLTTERDIDQTIYALVKGGI